MKGRRKVTNRGREEEGGIEGER
jgi:hypothetical protein